MRRPAHESSRIATTDHHHFVFRSRYLALGPVIAKTLASGTKQDYQVASHSIGPFLLLMSLFGTTMTAFALGRQQR